MTVNISGHSNRSVAKLAADVLQTFPVAQEERCKRVSSVMYTPAPDFRFVACFPEHAVPPVVHINVASFGMTDGLAFVVHTI